jgi:hypothetical protein
MARNNALGRDSALRTHHASAYRVVEVEARLAVHLVKAPPKQDKGLLVGVDLEEASKHTRHAAEKEIQ